MKGIKLLSLNKEQKKLLETSELNYKRFARIYFTIVKADNTGIFLKVEQKKNDAGNYLSAVELESRAKEVFEIVSKNVNVLAIPYEENPISEYSYNDIISDMAELGLQLKDVSKLLNINYSALSRLLTEGRNITSIHRAMFYYLFRYLKTKEK